MFIIFFYAITVLSRNCEAETQRQLCEYVSCPDYNDPDYHYEDCKTLDPGSVNIEVKEVTFSKQNCYAQLRFEVNSLYENCTLDIGIDGEKELEFNSTAFNETQIYILKKEAGKYYDLLIKEGIGKFIDIYFANEIKITYFLTEYHEKQKQNSDLTRKNSSTSSVIEFGIPLNHNMKACVKFNQKNDQNYFIIHKCRDKKGQIVDCNGVLSIDYFNQTANEWIAKISIDDSEIDEIKSTCLFNLNDTYSMFNYEFLWFNMTTFKMAEISQNARLNLIQAKSSSLSGGVVGVAVAIVLFCGVILIGYRHRVTKKIKHLRRISELSFPDEEEAIELADDPILDYCKNFPLKDFVHGKVIGEGEFGLVQKSTLVDGTARWDVALKTVKDRDALDKLKEEGEIMYKVGYNEHIVNLQGITVSHEDCQFFLVLEYCSKGSLYDYMLANKVKISYALANYELSPPNSEEVERFNQLISWSYQIGKGMEFLYKKSIVHGDLATRNVLLTSDLTAKLSDFGLSAIQIEDEAAELRSLKCPIRWMAPESLRDRVMTSSSDVWSFGITLWEIFSVSSRPYRGLQISGLQVADSADRLYNFLEGENRLDPPNHCPRSIYNLMLRCWNLEPKERPLFDSIVTELHALVNPQYHQTYDDRVRRLGEQHVTIQNKLYQLMTSENHIFPGISEYVPSGLPYVPMSCKSSETTTSTI